MPASPEKDAVACQTLRLRFALRGQVLGSESLWVWWRWAREFYKDVSYGTGPRLLDVLSDQELESLVRGLAGTDNDSNASRPKEEPLAEGADARLDLEREEEESGERPGSQSDPATASGKVQQPTPGREAEEAGSAGHRQVTPEIRTSAAAAAQTSDAEDQLEHALRQRHRALMKDVGLDVELLDGRLSRVGPVAATLQSVNSPDAHDGFRALVRRGRVDLTVEWIVVQRRFHDLFDQEVLDTAGERLRTTR